MRGGAWVMHPNIVLPFIEHLIELRQRSDPRHGESTAQGKDLNALTALRAARELSETLAGWAINHQVGLAAEGRESAGFAPHDHLEHPEYVEQRSAADDHRHELTGKKLQAEDIDAVIARKSM